MKWPEPSRVRGLSGWLIIATYELAEPAKERIRLEIEAHYADAVQCHMANGSTQTDAEAAALAELGDARVAAKRFRWRHLTEKDATYVERQLRITRSKLLLLSYYAIDMFVFLLFHELRHRILVATLLLLAVAVQTISFLVAKRNRSKPGLRLFASLYVLHFLIFGSILMIEARVHFPWVAFLCFQACRPLWICFKFWKVKDAQQELPPRDPTAA